MADPLVISMLFERFDAELAVDRDLWKKVLSAVERNGGTVTIVLDDRTLYDVTILFFDKDTLLSYAQQYGLYGRPYDDLWDMFWDVVDELIKRTDYDDYIFVPPEVSGKAYGALLLYKAVS